MAVTHARSGRTSGRSRTSAIKTVGRLVLDAVLPPQCLLSRELVSAPGELEASTWKKLHFLDDPFCQTCGVPFAVDPGPEALCPSCLAQSPAYNCARAALVYDDWSKRLVLDLKYRDRLDGVSAFAAWMTRAGGQLLDGKSLIVPIPLHYSRLVRRKFNQSALLALKLASTSQLDVSPDLLVRHRRTPSQKGLSWRARRRNVAGAFSIRQNRKEVLQDRNVVLVDDVFTTGATVEACAKTLKRHGAKRVDVLTLSRVVSMEQRLI